VAGTLVVLLGLLFLWQCHQRAGVWLAAPLDDTFIHFQYAKQLARGEVLRFNDGDSPTTGATSLLYILLLAPGWLIGFRGLTLLVWAWIINGLLHIMGAAAVFQCITRLTRQRLLAYSGMVAFLVSGPLLWGVFSQMEIALLSTLLLSTLAAAIQLERRDEQMGEDRPEGMKSVLIWGSLLALCRPEGALLAGGLSIWLLWRHLGQPPATEGQRWRTRLWAGRRLLIPLGMGVALVLFFALLTGRLGTNAAIKSHLLMFSQDPGRYLETSIRWLPMTLQILMGMWPAPLAPLITVLLLLGLGGWAAQQTTFRARDKITPAFGRRSIPPDCVARRLHTDGYAPSSRLAKRAPRQPRCDGFILSQTLRRPGAGALALLWLALLTCFYAFAMARRDHFDRYYLPYFGLTVIAIWWLLGKIPKLLPAARRAPVLVAALIILFMAPQTHFWAGRFGDNCRDLAQQHFQVARWVDKHTPSQARIAVNDAGAIPYLSRRYTYDIVGLAHNDFYLLKKVLAPSNAPVWEALEAQERPPQYMVAYPEWIPDLHGMKIFQPLKRFPLRRRTMVANDTKVVWKMRWDLVQDSSRLAPQQAAGKQLTDRLDVAHISHEVQHQYRLLGAPPPRGLVRQQAVGQKVLIDGGRLVPQAEEFVLRARPGTPAALVMRSAGPGRLDLKVEVDGQPAGQWRAPLQPGLGTYTHTLPGKLLKSEQVRIRLTAKAPYSSFHYWLLQ